MEQNLQNILTEQKNYNKNSYWDIFWTVNFIMSFFLMNLFFHLQVKTIKVRIFTQ